MQPKDTSFYKSKYNELNHDGSENSKYGIVSNKFKQHQLLDSGLGGLAVTSMNSENKKKISWCFYIKK